MHPPQTRSHSAGRTHESLMFEASALARLKARGHRITSARMLVIRALANSNKPLGAHGLHEAIVRAGGRIDVVSVYRILAAFSDLHLVHHIGVVDGYLACTRDSAHEHQMEHVICDRCGTVQELEVPQQAIEATEKQLSQLGFGPAKIKIEVVGTCTNCSTG